MEHDARGTELREVLVSRFNEPAPKVTRPARVAIAAVAAFALAGAGTGGAVAAWATGDNDIVWDTTPSGAAALLTTPLLESAIGVDTSPIGEPEVIAGKGELIVNLGTPPEGATRLALALGCLGEGTVDLTWEGVTAPDVMTCTSHGSTAQGTQLWVEAEGEHQLTFVSTGDFAAQFVWLSEFPRRSVHQTDVLSDGTVTREEYEASFDLLVACMASGGAPLGAVDKSGDLVDYSISDRGYTSGLWGRCYTTEFQDVDAWWQVARHEN